MCTWWVRYHAPSRCWRAEVENGLIPSVRAVPARGFAEWRELARPLLSSKPSWKAQSTPGMLLAVLCNDKLFSELWAVSSVQSVHFSLTKILWTHQVLRDMLFSCPFNQGRAVPPHPSCNCPRLFRWLLSTNNFWVSNVWEPKCLPGGLWQVLWCVWDQKSLFLQRS